MDRLPDVFDHVERNLIVLPESLEGRDWYTGNKTKTGFCFCFFFKATINSRKNKKLQEV